MEPPPLSAAVNNTPTTTPQPYPDSLDSTPRSRHTDSWDDPPISNTAATSAKLRLMCSYGGHIVPRPHDKSLCYIGGDTRIIVVERHVSLASLTARLSHSLMNGKPFVLKYQLPSEDLDSLISVTTDEDLENMIEEYERTSSNFQKPCRLRLFLFQPKLEVSQSIIESSTIKSDEWFLNALNGASLMDRGFSDSASVNCLLGLDDELVGGVAADGGAGGGGGSGGGGGGINESAAGGLQKKVQDVQSVPDSPMMETMSSFGSSSSSPLLANLPPIKVHVENGSGGGVKAQDQKVVVGIEEQFTQMNVGGGGGGPPKQQQEEGFAVLSSPAATTTVGAAGIPGEYVNRVFSDDERSDHGVPVGYRKTPPPAPPQSQSQQPPPQPQTLTIQSSQQKSSGGGGNNGGGIESMSPDSVSSDSSFTNAINRQKPMMYQDQFMQIQSGPNRVAVDPKINVSGPIVSDGVHIQQQVQDSGYVLQPQFEQHPQQQQQQQQQQFIHPGTHYIHHHPAGAVPISAYYQVYPSQQQPQQQQQLHHQLDQQYPVYYMQQARQPQAYNMSVQQPNTISEAPAVSRPQMPPSPAMVPQPAAYNPMRNTTHIAKPEMAAAAGMYRTTTTTGGPQLVPVPSSQHQQQYVGYSQMHHPSQSVAPTSAANANYNYEYADPAHAQIYYTQPLAPTMHSHYQTMTTTAGVMSPESSGQLPAENMKQQMRT